MQRVLSLLQKLNDLASRPDATAIDLDLMLDYTRVVYADLLEKRAKLAAAPGFVLEEPTLAELAAAMEDNAETEETETASLQTEAQQAADLDAALETVAVEPEEQPTRKYAQETAPDTLPENTDGPNPEHTPITPAATPGRPQKDIARLIGINEKYQYISMLYSNKTAAYEASLKHLNTLTSYQEAIAYLQDQVMWEHAWQEDSEHEMLFLSTLERFYKDQNK